MRAPSGEIDGGVLAVRRNSLAQLSLWEKAEHPFRPAEPGRIQPLEPCLAPRIPQPTLRDPCSEAILRVCY